MFDWLFVRQEWCCAAFRELHEARHGRGLFVFVRPPERGDRAVPSFGLAFRSILQKDLSRVQVLPADVPVTISTCQCIPRCPWCGAHLDDFYGKNWEKLLDPEILQEFESLAGPAKAI